MITFHQKIFALVVCLAIFLFVFELVRRRKLKEEYSWLWLAVSVAMFVLVLWYDLLLAITYFIGAEDPLTTLFLFGFIFMILINIDYSLQISSFKENIKKLAQYSAISNKDLEDLKNQGDK